MTDKYKERSKKYRLDNREAILKKHKQWLINNPKKVKGYMRVWYLEHREEILKEQKLRYLDNEGRARQYYLNNKERILKKLLLWKKDNPEKQAAASRKHDHKRRNLGFFPLNKYFQGSVGHHISQNFVIYMPEEIHRSMYHNIWTGRNMEQMNKLAIEFL